MVTKPALHSIEPLVSPFILLGLTSDLEPWPEELVGWAVCSKSLAISYPVMVLKEGTQADSHEVSRLTLLTLRNVKPT